MKANGFDISILNNIKPKLLMIYLKTNKGLNLDNEKSLKLQQQNLSEVLMFKDGIYGIKNGESKLIKIEEEEFKYFYIQNKLDIDSCQFNLKDKLEGNEILMKLPNTLKFISQVLGFNNPQLVAKYSLVLIYLAMLIYYKSHGGTKICKLQKLLSLTGPGGSGKSTLQDWFQKFVDETQVFATKSKHLSERFEKGFIKDKILLFINEIVPKNKGAIDVESLGDILSLSGADRQRSETKYESATTFNWDGLVVMTSNYPILTNTVESYGALKRRIINMVCLGNFMKGNRIRTQSIMSSLEDEIKLIKVLALQYIPLNIESILTFIEDFNTEQEILNHEETSLYSTHVDPLLCFLSEVVDNSDNNNNLVSFQQLKALYIHYIYRRSESNLTIEDFDD
jgi:phage/plasmid-associated DNA primase